ncbi:MAG: hypothetical protein SCALA702_09300 [Melioribacteraceae bacterium]|nr:MAG: hypothetical protein SCALA702_09300 [Melioribacteraceae bacterium]
MGFENKDKLMAKSEVNSNVELLKRRLNDLEEMILTSKEYEQRFNFIQHVLDNVHDAIIATDLQDKITLWNESAERMYGWKAEDVIGEKLDSVIPTEIFGLSLNELKLILLAQGHWHGQATHLNKNGEEKRIDLSVSILKNKRGVDMGMVSINRDITEKKHAEKVLKETEQKFRRLVEHIPSIAVSGFNKDRKVIFWNSACEALYGYTKDEAFGAVFEDLIFPESMKPKIVSEIEDWIDKGIRITPGEFGLKKKDGEIIPVHSSHVMLRSHINEIEMYQIDIDLSEIKKAELALRTERDKAQRYFEIAGAILMVLNDKGVITLINQKGCKALGYWEQEIVGKNWFDNFLPKENIQEVKEIFNRVMKGEITQSERFVNYINTRSGEKRTIAWHNTLLRDDDGKITGILSSGEDITDTKKAEEALRFAKEKAEKSDRLKSEFLAQMSHEIRTPINSILSFTNFIEEELDDKMTEDLEMGFDIIKIGGKRLIRTIDLILNMSEIQAGTYDYVPKKLDFYLDICTNLIDEFKHQAETKGLSFNLNKKVEDSSIKADEYTVIQIFNNLLDNAVKYTMEGKVELVIDRDTKGRLVVDVVDTGIGISKNYLPKLFNMFSQEDTGYSRTFEGNGLGLALVKNYAELNKAEIKVKSEKNKGSVFRIIFPASKI